MESDGEDLENIFDEYENNEHDTGAENVENNTAEETPGAVKIAAPKRIVKNPRLKFNAERLCGERGIPVLVDHFKDVKFKGSGYEKEDLDKLLSKLEHWTHRLFPSMKFEDCLTHIERLGKKRPVQTCLRKIRLDMPILNSDFVKDNEEDDVKRNGDSEPEEIDAFDRLLGESREIPSIDESALEDFPSTSSFYSSPMLNNTTAHVLGSSFGSSLTEEQKERMERNKMLAAERRKARLAAMEQNTVASQSDEATVSENALSKQTSFDKLFGSSDCNEENAENNKSGSETCNDFDESSNNPSNLNYDNSEKLGLDELMNLVDEEDPISEENAIISSQEQIESVSANINEISEVALDDSDDAVNCNLSVLENSTENSREENLNIKSSLDLICETSVDSTRNADVDCTLKSMPIRDENVIMKNVDSTSMDCEDENSHDDGVNINEINKCPSDDAENFKNIEDILENTRNKILSSPKISEKFPEENLNTESSLDLISEISINSEINTNVDCSVKDSSVNDNVIMENDNMECEDENS